MVVVVMVVAKGRETDFDNNDHHFGCEKTLGDCGKQYV